MKIVYVEFLFPGTFFPELSLVPFAGEPIPVPANAYGWSLKKRQEVLFGEEMLVGKLNKLGGTTLIGHAYSLAELKAEFGSSEKHRILISNIEGNGYLGACLCRTGNWQPIDEDTTVVPAADSVTP
ncbi:MAG: hypothetical protein ACTHMK_13875 [Dyella sp.]|uniref:hypothetical protein n=1 Tax=Dyella sp. TaxID=1869338 RepID=UPI003F8012DE